MIAFFFRSLLWLASGFLLAGAAGAAPLPPEQVSIPERSVVIVYNQNLAESRVLAEYYAEKRKIPHEQLVALDCSQGETISRREFRETIESPLRETFTREGWWRLADTGEQGIQATRNRIRLLVLMRGVPLRIKREVSPELRETIAAAKAAGQTPPKEPLNEASVDSELALLGVFAAPAEGFVKNPFFEKDESFLKLPVAGMLLVGRLDGPSAKGVIRMIDEALAAEEGGLWGRAWLDVGGPHKKGDVWIEEIAQRNRLEGMPVFLDRNRATYPKQFPMRDAALYYGWYTTHRNGPLLSPDWRFKPGAVAIHIHSFSGATVRQANKHWAGPILAKGAAATVGNVWEPYLEMTNYLHVFNDRLLKGYSLIEASAMSVPVLSWMNVTLGDPLYRPFAKWHVLTSEVFSGSQDKAYRLARLDAKQSEGQGWKALQKRVAETARTIGSGDLFEAVAGWELLEAAPDGELILRNLLQARARWDDPADRLRVDLMEGDWLRRQGKTAEAGSFLGQVRSRYAEVPEVSALDEWLGQLTPQEE
ncbi:MAG: TIGR03790 family protein [Verrucomicrobiota bacterium]